MDLVTLLPSFGNLLYTLAAFVIALSVIVTVHEYGHYIIGRWSGIHAEVFSLGFGPVIYSRVDRRGTRWQVAALPLGGYVKFLGDANAASAGADEETMAHLTPTEKRHTMHGAPLWARAATVAAGPVFNFILSIALFAAIFMVSGVATNTPSIGSTYALPGGIGELETGDEIRAIEGRPTPDYPAVQEVADEFPTLERMQYLVARGGAETTVEGPAVYPARINAVTPDSAAMAAGLREGDVILAINGAPVRSFAELQGIVKTAGGNPLDLRVWRAGEAEFEVTLTPKRTDLPLREGGFETRYLIGIGGGFFFEPVTRSVGPLEAVSAGAGQLTFVVTSSLSAVSHMITGAISSCNLRGPLGIAETSGAAASAGFADFIWFLAVLSTAVGLMNLFPIPVLDGGHLVFHAWEWAAGKPPPDGVMRVLMLVGLALVLSLMAFGLTNDLRC